jgi:hypothetical protein
MHTPPDSTAVATIESPPRTTVGEPERSKHVNLAEVGALSAAGIVGAGALVSLAAAHLHQHRPVVVFGGSAVLIVVVAAVILAFNRPRVRMDLRGLAPPLVGMVFAAVMFFPGFYYATSDRDPGAYVEIAAVIQRDHSIEFRDDLLDTRLPDLTEKVIAGRQTWPALWRAPGTTDKIFPQFYHLWPALLATAKDAGGWMALFNLGPLCGLISVALAVAVARRLAGLPAAWAAAIILPTNMLEVWQAKYPTSEILGQMLFLAGVLGVVVAIRSGWVAAAAVAGPMFALGFLDRADGIIVVLMAWTVLAALLAARRFDMRAVWFGAGLLILLSYGFYQAYHLARIYTVANGIPGQRTVVAYMLGTASVGALLAWQRTAVQRLIAITGTKRTQAVLGGGFVGLCAVLMVIGLERRRLFGLDYTGTGALRTRTWDEASFIRLTWFFTLPGFALLLVGIALFVLARWRLDRWLVLLATVSLLGLYCWHVRNSPYLMWSARRFVPTVVPGIVILIGAGVACTAWLIAHYVPRPAAWVAVAAALVGFAAFNLSESWPLRGHDENGGSLQVVRRLAALPGGDRSVFLFNRGPARFLFGGSMLTIGDRASASMSAGRVGSNADLRSYVDHFGPSDRPLYYVWDAASPLPPVAGVSAERVLHLAGTLPHWQQTFDSRPKKQHDYTYELTVYRLRQG